MAEGFQASLVVDFDEMFSLVVKPTTIRTILNLAISHSRSLCQLDDKNAFLHGDLVETVYMEQSPRFVNFARPTHFGHLQNAIYGLKQAPYAWFQHVSSFPLQYSFMQYWADYSLFIYRLCSNAMLFLLYVDSIILIGNQPSQLSSFVYILDKEFEPSNLGP